MAEKERKIELLLRLTSDWVEMQAREVRGVYRSYLEKKLTSQMTVKGFHDFVETLKDLIFRIESELKEIEDDNARIITRIPPREEDNDPHPFMSTPA